MAKYELDVVYEAAAEDGKDETCTYRGYDDGDLLILQTIEADWKSGKLSHQLRADPRLRVVGVKSVTIRKIG